MKSQKTRILVSIVNLSNRWKKLLFCLFLALFCVKNVISEEFISKQHGFSMSYPDGFERIELKIANLALALRTPNKPYPTINIIVQPGPYNWRDKHPKSEQERVIDSYRAVGILDAKVKTSSVSQHNNTRLFRANIAYQYNNQKLESLVGIVTSEDRHYIITCIDTEAEFANSLRIFSAVLESFQLLNNVGQENLDTSNPKVTLFTYLITISVILTVIAISYLLYKRLSTS